jgi:hypothetical protein
MKFDYYTYQIGVHYLSAIINGDTSGLSDGENLELDLFLDNLPVNNGHWDIVNYDGEVYFKRCDVSGLFSECLEARLYFPLVEAAV